jgi:hypothetical protein
LQISTTTILTNLLVKPLALLEQRPLWDTMTKEVVGINAPKVIFTRTNDERADVAVNEFGNTIGFVAAGVGTEALLNKAFHSPSMKAGLASASGKIWEAMSRSGALYSAIFATMWAMPFLRNYYTAKRTGQVDYTDVIGAKRNKKTESPEVKQARLQQKLKEYRNMTLKILGLGALGVVGSLGAGVLLSRLKPQAGTIAKWVHQHLTLAEGKFNDFSGVKALLFWGLPAYGGWMHASRDPYEKKEQVAKFINFVACFIGPQMLLSSLFKGRFNALMPQGLKPTFENILGKLSGEIKTKALRLKVIQEFTGLASSIALFGITPALFNITMTQKRLEQAANREVAFQNAALAGTLLQRKTFEPYVLNLAQNHQTQRTHQAGY